MSYTAQELNTRITFERLTYALDSNGDPIRGPQGEFIDPEWIEYGEAFAKVEPLVGREFLAAAAIQAENNIKVTFRYREGIEPADRLLIRGQPWGIESIQNIRFQNRELLLYCKRLN